EPRRRPIARRGARRQALLQRLEPGAKVVAQRLEPCRCPPLAVLESLAASGHRRPSFLAEAGGAIPASIALAEGGVSRRGVLRGAPLDAIASGGSRHDRYQRDNQPLTVTRAPRAWPQSGL